jgi:hypothetical protein
MTFNGDWLGDNTIMTEILDKIDFYSGTERKLMLKVNPKEGGSMLYGTTWRGYLSPTKNRTFDEETGKYRTKIYDLHPELKDIFKEFADYHFPEFAYSQVQMNKNFCCPPHVDSKNIGESVLCCFGNFTGGETCLYIDEKIVKVNAKEEPQRFNGSQILHWVNQYKGTRYSLVFFNNQKKK